MPFGNLERAEPTFDTQTRVPLQRLHRSPSFAPFSLTASKAVHMLALMASRGTTAHLPWQIGLHTVSWFVLRFCFVGIHLAGLLRPLHFVALQVGLAVPSTVPLAPLSDRTTALRVPATLAKLNQQTMCQRARF